MATITRNAPADARRDRPILSLDTWRSQNSSVLPDAEHSDDSRNLTPLQRWEAQLWADRNRWDIDRRRSGLFGSRQIDKVEAARLLKQSIVMLTKGGVA